MNDENPYASPSAESSDGAKEKHPPTIPYVWTLLLFVVGGSFLGLMNGQVFSNGLIFLAFVAASAYLWLRHRNRVEDSKLQGRAAFIVLLHVVFMVLLVGGVAAIKLFQ